MRRKPFQTEPSLVRSPLSRPWTRRRALTGLGAAVAGGALLVLGTRTARATATVAAPRTLKRFMTEAAGSADGSSWPNAMAIDQLGEAINTAEPGAGFLIGFDPADLRPVAFKETGIRIRASGTAEGLIQLRAGLIGEDGGLAAPGDAELAPFFTSARPWSLALFAKKTGIPCYVAIERGASHLYLAGFRVDGTTGDGFIKFRAGKDAPATFANVRIAEIAARNVGRVIETDKNAALTDLIVEDCRVSGIVRGFARFRKISNSVLRNLDLDSANLDGGRRDVCQLIAVSAGDNLTFENVTLKNALNAQIKSDGKQGYVQGDGIVCERGTSNIVIRNCHGSGMGDGAFDLKSTNVTIEDSSTDACKFGIRIWSEGTNVIRRCTLRNPVARGKNHGACIQVSGTAEVIDSQLQAGPGQAAISLQKLKNGNLPVVRMAGGAIQLDGDARLARSTEGGTLHLEGVAVNGELRTETLVLKPAEGGGDDTE